jgi:hypothetical protein
MKHIRSTLSTTLAFTLASSLVSAQSPPCLGPFQRVASTSTVSLNERMLFVAVSGANALGRIEGPSTQGAVNIVEAFRELAPGGPWVATQAWPLAGARGRFALDGDRAAFYRQSPFFEIAVFERQPATGMWLPTFAVPLASPPVASDPRLSGESLVLPYPDDERIDIWRRATSGAFTLEATILSPSALDDDFGRWLDIDGDRLAVRHASSVYLYQRDTTGAWPLEVRIQREPHFDFNFSEPLLSDGRLVVVVRSPVESDKGLAFWRLVAFPGGISAVYDGVVFEDDVMNEFHGLLTPATASSTAVQRLSEPACGTPDPAFAPLAVIGAGDRDLPVVDGYVCRLAGFAGPGDSEYFDYDGRTLAVAVPQEVGAPRNNVHFAALLGADIDGDRNCVEDSVEIATTPTLDRNGNGRLDSIEERGEEFCVPLGPNSVGNVATLRVIGTEHRLTNDLIALASGLPPGAFGVVAVALAPVPLPAQQTGPFGVCLTGAVGRYSAVQAGTDGVATTSIPLGAVPTPNGSIHAYLYESWAWQLVYRDGSVPGATSAVAVTVR